MKKFFLFLFPFMILASCAKSDLKSNQTLTTYGGIYPMEEYTIDGCQYVGYLYGKYNDWCTHKGNCNNPIHKLQKDTL